MMQRDSSQEHVQAVRAVNKDYRPIIGTPADPADIYIDCHVDPVTHKEFILWDDIVQAFEVALQVRHKAIMLRSRIERSIQTLHAKGDGPPEDFTKAMENYFKNAHKAQFPRIAAKTRASLDDERGGQLIHKEIPLSTDNTQDVEEAVIPSNSKIDIPTTVVSPASLHELTQTIVNASLGNADAQVALGNITERATLSTKTTKQQ
ncbi:hypothetical protein BGX23_009518 [Mortierella sp. AD031]|nr:hypothetical protein BGX23_009518 [Mortierella sp. AD031]